MLAVVWTVATLPLTLVKLRLLINRTRMRRVSGPLNLNDPSTKPFSFVDLR